MSALKRESGVMIVEGFLILEQRSADVARCGRRESRDGRAVAVVLVPVELELESLG